MQTTNSKRALGGRGGKGEGGRGEGKGERGIGEALPNFVDHQTEYLPYKFQLYLVADTTYLLEEVLLIDSDLFIRSPI